MLNYYKEITDKELFIMDVQKENGVLKVTFADESIRYFEDTEDTRTKINQARDKQIEKILKKYSSKKLKKEYKKARKNILHKQNMRFYMIWLIKFCLCCIFRPSFGLLGNIFLTVIIPNMIIWGIVSSLAKKELAQLEPLQSQIEEVEKLELFEEEENKINDFIQEKTNYVVEEHLRSSDISIEEAKSIKNYAKITIHDLDKITLQQLRKFLTELEVEQTMGANYQEQSFDSEQSGFQKSR